jgi:hypothetical protein
MCSFSSGNLLNASSILLPQVSSHTLISWTHPERQLTFLVTIDWIWRLKHCAYKYSQYWYITNGFQFLTISTNPTTPTTFDSVFDSVLLESILLEFLILEINSLLQFVSRIVSASVPIIYEIGNTILECIEISLNIFCI